MLIISQNEDKITENLNFSIVVEESCKNIFIEKKEFEKYKRIAQKNGNSFTITELKGLGEIVGKNLTRFVFKIIGGSRSENFGIFSSKEQAQRAIRGIVENYEKGDVKYQFPKDKNAEIAREMIRKENSK